jgi:NHL repeat
MTAAERIAQQYHQTINVVCKHKNQTYARVIDYYYIHMVNKIKVFTSFGKLLKVIDLKDVIHPCHTIQLTPDKFVVCHGNVLDGKKDPVQRVCIVNGKSNVQLSFGSSWGSDENQVRGPVRLAVVNGFIFVTDRNNHRVLMLSPTLRYVRTVVSKLSGFPHRMWFDEQTGRLYLSENKYVNGKWTTGHVSVYDVGN